MERTDSRGRGREACWRASRLGLLEGLAWASRGTRARDDLLQPTDQMSIARLYSLNLVSPQWLQLPLSPPSLPSVAYFDTHVNMISGARYHRVATYLQNSISVTG
jgi:hypothetical protein